MEDWRAIPGLEDRYEVSSRGRVRHAATGRVRKPYTRPGSGYGLVSIRGADAVRSLYVHRAVLMAFDPRADYHDLEVNHKDFDTRNNAITNLEWVTKAENLRYTWRAGRQAQANVARSHHMAERHRRAKLHQAAVVAGAGP